MPKKYRTISGDLWDLIAFKTLGSSRHVDKLINANRKNIETFIFPADENLTIPDIDTTKRAKLPPWRK